MSIDSSGVIPQTLELSTIGSSVFFLNSTNNSQIDLKIEFGKKKAHCATGGMKMGEDGVFRSDSPIEPSKFVTVCFPNKGNYPVNIQKQTILPNGKTQTKHLRAKIVVK
jgi:hypothetical protein